MSEIRLNQVMIGIGNNVHDQFHRSNRIDILEDLANRAAHERFSGGITPATIAQMGITGGGLAAQHSGLINVEGGWNQRRGLAMLRMTVVNNSLQEDTMSVLGYLSGGGMAMGSMVPDDVLFIPVRSWTMSTSATQDVQYMPTTSRMITETSQFLMADPEMIRQLRTIRPVDVITHGFGSVAAEEEDSNIPYAGSTNADLNHNGVIVSKGSNLDPLTNAQTIMTHAARVSRQQVSHNLLSENMAMSMGGISEQEIFEHPFLSLMMSALGMPSYQGFIGFTFGELRQVFQGFDTAVLPATDRNIEAHNHQLDSDAMGEVSYHEKIANELAFICMHAMIDVGLVFLEFAASNTSSNMGILNGDIYFNPGIPAGVLPNDPNLQNRVESLKDYISSTFFQKYAVKALGNSTPMEVAVKMNLFGECVVDIVLNGDYANSKKKVFPSYTINRASSNLATDEAQESMAMQYVDNLKNYFIK